MHKMYWKINKNAILGYIATAILFIIVSYIFVTSISGLEQVDPEVNDIISVVGISVMYGIASFGMFAAYLYLVLKPFFQKHFELLVQVGENIVKYTVLHIAIVMLLNFISDIITNVIFNNYLGVAMEIPELSSALDLQTQIKSTMGSVATVAWILIIPLSIYNDKILRKAGTKNRMWIIILSVLAIWGALSFVATVPELIQSFRAGMEYGVAASGVISDASVSIIGDMNIQKQQLYSYIVDAIGIGAFILAFIGFSRNYTVRK